jgi:hypothetical protein
LRLSFPILSQQHKGKKVLTKEGGENNRACTADIRLANTDDESRNKYQRRNESEG